MKMKASVGRAPSRVSLNDRCYSLTLTAETEGEKQALAALFNAVRSWAPTIILQAENPEIQIEERRRGRLDA